MKKEMLLSLLMLLTGSILPAQTKVDTLTNEEIIQLAKIGLQPSVIISKIQTSVHKFDVSTDGLINLSKNGVASEIINEMMKADAQLQKDKADQKDMRDPKSKRKSGIYYYNPADSAKMFRRLEPTVMSSIKSGSFGNAVARAYTGGIAKAKIKASLGGANSRQQIEETTPVFYFYFESNSISNADNWYFTNATSPNEFTLVKLDENKDNREIILGSESNFKTSSGIPDKAKVAFDFEETVEGIYKVTFKEPLKKGEYCFLYASSTPTNYNNDKVFDFGIQNMK